MEPTIKNFSAVVHKDAGSAFGVRFLDLPTVFSAADHARDLVANAIEALRIWAEDEALPVPATLDQLMVRDDIKMDLADGAFLVNVPLIPA